MPSDVSKELSSQAVELGHLLTTTIGAVAEAQERMDDYTLRRKREFEEAPEGTFALPPLWYVFDKVAVEIELSATVRSTRQPGENPAGARADAPRLFCRTLTPASVSLYGHEAAAGLKVSVQLGPRAVLPLKDFEAK